VVAVGNLAGVWTDIPEGGELEEIKKGFRQVFHYQWDEVLVGRDAPSIFQFWNGYLGISELRPQAGPAVARLKELCRDQGVYDIILG